MSDTETSYDYICKFVNLGNRNVGKTSLLIRFVTQQFDPHVRSTIGVDHFSTIVNVHGDKVKVQLWDTSSQDRFRSMVRVYFRAAPGAMVVYDVTDAASFAAVPEWVAQVREHAISECAIMLVGNKTDLGARRVVSTEEGAEYARANHLMFLETSALSDSNVREAFQRVLEQVHTVRASLDAQRMTRMNTPPVAGGRTVSLEEPVAGGADGRRARYLSCCSIS